MLPLFLHAALAADVDQPLHGTLRSDADAAVVIGIEDYAFLPDVPYAGRDASAVRTWLQSSRGLPPERVQVLVDASREQILAALDRAIASVGPEGTLWFFYAGHGAASPDGGGRLLLGVDVMPDPAVFAARAIPVGEVEAKLAKAPASVLWMDTCYAGTGRDGSAILPNTRFAVPVYASGPPTGPSVQWSAASAGELSSAHHPSRHGAFTWATLRALRGEADGELDGQPDGKITAAESQAFVVRALAAEGIHHQTPTLTGDGTVALVSGLPEVAVVPMPSPQPLAKVPKPPASPKRRNPAPWLGVASAATLGVALATRQAYVSAGPASGPMEGLVVVNQVAAWSGLGMGATAVGFAAAGGMR